MYQSVKQWTFAAVLASASITSAQAGLFDTLSQVTNVVNAVAPQTQTQIQPAANQAQLAAQQNQLLAQSLAAMDCPTLQALALSTDAQLQALPEENQISKTAGLVGKAGGFFASIGAATGVDVGAIQKASSVAQQANSLAASTSTTGDAAVSRQQLTDQLTGVQLAIQSKSCK